MRARYPDQQGQVIREGVSIAFDVYENAAPTILLMPTWSIIHSRHWKAQIPYLARHFRVVTFDGRGNGRSDRPLDPAAYSDDEFVDDALAVLDASETQQAIVAGMSFGGHWAAMLGGLHPQRVAGLVLIAAVTSLPHTPLPERSIHPFDGLLDLDDGWAKYNAAYWRSNYRDFCEFFFAQIFTEPHSTKQHEDAVAWSQETDGETLISTERAGHIFDSEERALLEAIECPVLLIHGTNDRITDLSASEVLATVTGGTLLIVDGGGHLPPLRDPVRINLAIKDFVDRLPQRESA